MRQPGEHKRIFRMRQLEEHTRIFRMRQLGEDKGFYGGDNLVRINGFPDETTWRT
jgi:hypothetical protein